MYIISHVEESRFRRKRGKRYVAFVDLTVAFDKLDRKVLWKTNEEMGVRKEFIERV